MQKWLTVFAMVLSLGLVGCAPDEEAAKPEPQLKAKSYSEAVDQIAALGQSYQAAADRLRAYDNGFEDLPSALAWAKDSNPMIGDYKHYSKVDWPTPNAAVRFINIGENRRMLMQGLDLTNGSVNEGEAQIFIGIKDIAYQNDQLALPKIPIVMITESLVKLNGVYYYRDLKVHEGYLVGYDLANGPRYDGVPGSVFVGRYNQIITELFDAAVQEGGITGLVQFYDAYLVRTSGGGGFDPNQNNLTITLSGTGQGHVSDIVNGVNLYIDCGTLDLDPVVGTQCSHIYPLGELVQLRPLSRTGSTFTG